MAVGGCCDHLESRGTELIEQQLLSACHTEQDSPPRFL
jgi:hypothetical protein